jgi:hypothetical protein
MLRNGRRLFSDPRSSLALVPRSPLLGARSASAVAPASEVPGSVGGSKAGRRRRGTFDEASVRHDACASVMARRPLLCRAAPAMQATLARRCRKGLDPLARAWPARRQVPGTLHLRPSINLGPFLVSGRIGQSTTAIPASRP